MSHLALAASSVQKIHPEGNSIGSLSETNPYTGLFWDMVMAARSAQASDIHIQPEREGVDIRFRVFGILERWKWIAITHKALFLQEAKRLSRCSLALSGKPQDARLSLPEYRLDLRVSLLPTLEGEKLVLRLLDQSKDFKLTSLGLDPSVVHAISGALSHSTGVTLLTGPTGSGKTTVLYSALAELDRIGLNIITIENPVEYRFSGISQIEISQRLTFGDALRTVLRQDPDVILVGEVRDEETAALCFQAAATGHTVLSTLHANSALEIDQRLRNLGVPQDLIDSCLRFRSAQRLLPKLCQNCALPLEDQRISNRNLELIPEAARITLRTRNPRGCQACASRRNGYSGSSVFFEYIESKEQDTNQNGATTRAPYQSTCLGESARQAALRGEVDVYDALQLA